MHSTTARSPTKGQSAQSPADASSGLGEAAARHLAANGAKLVLGARRLDRLHVRPGNAVYAATRAAVLMLSEGLRQEAKPHNIRTTVISPGAVQSELPQSVMDPDAARNIAAFYKSYAIPADSFARAVALAIGQPDDMDINEILFRPTAQEFQPAREDNTNAPAHPQLDRALTRPASRIGLRRRQPPRIFL